MKKRLILSSFILSLFLLLFSCGIPNWFYINSYNVSNSTTNKTTTFSINSEFELDISFFLVYSIHNEDVETSTIRSGLLNRFIKEYNANNTNNPIRPLSNIYLKSTAAPTKTNNIISKNFQILL